MCKKPEDECWKNKITYIYKLSFIFFIQVKRFKKKINYILNKRTPGIFNLSKYIYLLVLN